MTAADRFQREAIAARVSDVCVHVAEGFDLEAHVRLLTDTVVAAKATRDPYLATRRAARTPSQDARTAPYPEGVYVQ